MKKAFPVVILACFLCACAAKTGNQFLEKTSNEQIEAYLVKGRTTKDQVRQGFGDPLDIDFLPNGLENWTYSFSRSEAKAINFVPYANLVYSGTNDTTRRLKILFSKNGTVESHAFTNSAGETKYGLGQ